MSEQPHSISADIWKERINDWQTSGKTVAQWCRDNHYVYSQCIYWKTKFLGPEKQSPSNFTELSDEERAGTGIKIEIDETLIHLASEFDQTALFRCIKLLKGASW